MSALPQGSSPDPDASQVGEASAVSRGPENSADAGVARHQEADIGSQIRAALANEAVPGPVADGGSGGGTGGSTGEPIYDGHVPLALDADFQPAIDSTLDLLTTSADLFDVPVADFGSSDGDGV